MRYFYLVLTSSVVSLLYAQALWAVCASLVQGEIIFKVNKCGPLSPEKNFPLKQDRYQFIRDLSPEDRKSFYDSYRGLLAEGQVVKSSAIRSGFSPERGVLQGQSIKVFISPGVSECSKIHNKRVKAFMDEACCEGGGDVPCLLDSAYVLTKVETIDEAHQTASSPMKAQVDYSEEFRKANYYLSIKNFQAAAEIYEKLRMQNQLSLRGHYFLGFSYRMMDQCVKANSVLNVIFRASEENLSVHNDESVITKASFLLARCLAIVGNADRSVLVLQSLLLAVEQNRREIELSLTHPDFGRIKTSKVYYEYTQDALKSLKNHKVDEDPEEF